MTNNPTITDTKEALLILPKLQDVMEPSGLTTEVTFVPSGHSHTKGVTPGALIQRPLLQSKESTQIAVGCGARELLEVGVGVGVDEEMVEDDEKIVVEVVFGTWITHLFNRQTNPV